MREIEFRAFVKRKNELIYIKGFRYSGKEKIKITFADEDSDDCTYTFLSKDVVLEQFTGLRDKNGVKIYEGDVVKTHYANAINNEFIEIVVFHNGRFVTYFENNGCKSWSNIFDGVEHLSIDKSVYMESIEVIGNTHEGSEDNE